MKKIAILLGTLAILSGCGTVTTRGAFIEDDIVDQINSQKMTKEQLVLNLGSPSIKPDYSPNVWYYVGRTVKNSSIYEPKLKKQRIFKITFNKQDIVEKVEIIDAKKQPKIAISKDHTISKGTEENPVQSFVKNFGRFNNKKRTKRR